MSEREREGSWQKERERNPPPQPLWTLPKLPLLYLLLARDVRRQHLSSRDHCNQHCFSSAAVWLLSKSTSFVSLSTITKTNIINNVIDFNECKWKGSVKNNAENNIIICVVFQDYNNPTTENTANICLCDMPS